MIASYHLFLFYFQAFRLNLDLEHSQDSLYRVLFYIYDLNQYLRKINRIITDKIKKYLFIEVK
jgi:hypothetical protein